MGLDHCLPSNEITYSDHTVPMGLHQRGCAVRKAMEIRPESSMVKRGRVFFAVVWAPPSGAWSGLRVSVLWVSGSRGSPSSWLPVISGRAEGIPTRVLSIDD